MLELGDAAEDLHRELGAEVSRTGTDVLVCVGSGAWLSRIVYALVGLSAIYQAMQWKSIQRRWLAMPAN